MRIDPNARRLRSVLWLAALLASLVTGSRALAAPAPFAPTAAQCPHVDELSAAERARVRCGRLEVPENHALPEGRKIDLMVAVVEPPDNRPRDPLVLIHGGPGDGWVHQYRYRLAGSFGERTTIMFDQRGVGMSQPALCPELSDTLFEALTSGRPLTEQTARLVTASRGCHDRLIAQGIDPSQYNTMATVADMEALRTALGFSRWNLYGVSYGTTVGLAYLKQHPERIRALITIKRLRLRNGELSNGHDGLLS
jgi:pimeloyl-ACP methyl ester carboxylesterase